MRIRGPDLSSLFLPSPASQLGLLRGLVCREGEWSGHRGDLLELVQHETGFHFSGPER